MAGGLARAATGAGPLDGVGAAMAGVAKAGAATTAAPIIPIKLRRILVLLLPTGPGPWRAEAEVFFPRALPFGLARAQRFFECTTAMSAVLPVPWQTKQDSLVPSAALRVW